MTERVIRARAMIGCPLLAIGASVVAVCAVCAVCAVLLAVGASVA
jgi:hypothetical protein